MALGYGNSYGYSYGLADPVRLLVPSEDILPVPGSMDGSTAFHGGATGALPGGETISGTFGSGLPIDMLGAPYTGVRSFSLYDDFYDRFYVKPPVLDFGIVARETVVPYTVWNARIEPAVLNSVSAADLDEDGVGLTGVATPRAFAPLEDVTHVGVAAQVGSTKIEGSYLYLFTPSQAVVLPVQGVRGKLWPFPPNWASGFRQQLDFKTEIITSRSGKEQRMALRTTPRRSVEFTSHVSGERRKELNRILDIFQFVDFVVPDVPRSVRLANPVASGSAVLPLESTPDWAASGTIIVLSHGSMVSLQRILEVDALANTVTLDEPVTESYSAGTRVSPGLVGNLNNDIQTRRLTNDVVEAVMRLDEKPGYREYVAPPAASVIHNGREVLLEKPNWDSVPTITAQWETELVDFDRGVVFRHTPTEFGTRLIRQTYFRSTYATVKALIDAFMRARGRRGEFYMPTFESDIVAKTSLISGQSKLRVEGLDLFNTYAGSTVYNRIMVQLNNGTRIYRKLSVIETISDGFGSDSYATVDSPWPSTILPGDISMICFLPLCRFASDSITVDWLTDNKANVQFSIQTLEDQPPES